MLVLRGDGSVVTLLVLRRYGVYTVFDSRMRYLSQPVLRRESSGPSFRRWRASFESRKSYRPQAADRIRVSVWGGAPPMSRLSALVILCDEKCNFYPCIKTLTRFTHL